MRLNTVLRYSLIGGLFILPFIPLVVAQSMFFPFITGKNFMFRIIVEVLLGGWLILLWRDASFRPRFSWVAAALVAFVGVITLADILGENFFRSFWSNFERMEGLITLLHLTAYFFIVSSLLNTKRLWWWFANTSLGISLIVGLYSVFQLVGVLTINQGGVRIDATLGNATYLAIYILFHIFIAVYLLALKGTHRVLRVFYGTSILFLIFILFNTATRGAILGLIGGTLLAALLIAFFERKNKILRKTAAGILVAVVLVVGGFIAMKDASFVENSSVLSRLSNISLQEGGSRFQVWNMAWQAFKERPILGWGQEHFLIAFNKYYTPEMYNQEPWFDRAHDVVFDWLVSGGTLGLLSYLSLFGAALYYIWFYRRKEGPLFSITEKALLTGLFAGYFFQNLFVFDNITSYLLFVSFLAFIHSRAVERQLSSRELESRAKLDSVMAAEADKPRLFDRWFVNNIFVGRLYAPVVILLVVLSVYSLNVKGILANRALLHGIDLRLVQGAQSAEEQQRAFERNLAGFEKALSYNTVGRTETKEQFAQVMTRVSSLSALGDLKQQGFLRAQEELEKQIAIVPNNARLHLFLATLLSTYGQNNEAVTVLEEALKISPNKQHIYFVLATSYINIGEYEKAFETAKTAYELAPQYEAAARYYGATALYARQDEIAKEQLVPIYGTVMVPEPIFINAYVVRGEYGKVVSLWEAVVKENQSSPQPHLSLAAAYNMAGRPNNAIAEIERVIELVPTFRPQGEELIRRIRAGEKI